MKLKIGLINEESLGEGILAEELMMDGHFVNSYENQPGLLVELSKFDPGLLIFNLSKPSKEILEIIKIINFAQPKPIIVLAKKSGSINANEVIKSGVSSYIVDGVKPGRMKAIIDVAMARFLEHQEMCNELNQFKEKLDDRKWVDKAKGILMELKGMSEDDAYKAMRTMAMENNRRLVDIAKNIISVSQITLEK